MTGAGVGVTAIILAAGAGTRMGSSQPKQLLDIGGELIIDRAISPFLGWADQVIVTLPDEMHLDFERLPEVDYTTGGATRTESVLRALELARHDKVLVHDAARPFVTRVILNELSSALDSYACAYPVMPVVNTIVVDDDGMLAESPPRASFREVQTPQGFKRDVLVEALATFGEDHSHLPELVRRMGHEVKHTTGSPWLFKITYAPSLYMAQYYVEHVDDEGKHR